MVKSVSDDDARLFADALSLHQRGELREADAGYAKVLALNPRHVEALHHRGIVAITLGSLDAAVDLIGRAIVLDGSIPECHYHIGIAFGALRRFDEALKHNRRAIELRPGYAAAYMNLANALKAQQRPTEALANYRSALALQPRSCESHYNIANLVAEMGRHDEAAGHYRLALGLNPDHAPTHNNLGTALKALGQREDAIRHFERAATLDPALIEAAVNAGDALRDVGRPAEAIRWYRHAIGRHPNALVAHQGLAAALKVEGDVSGAAFHQEQAQRLKREFRGACIAQARALFGGDLGGALTLLKRANDTAEDAETRALLFGCLADQRSLPYAHAYGAELARALIEPWGDPRDILNVSIAVLRRDPTVSRCVPCTTGAIDIADLAEIARNRLFLALLVSEPLSWIDGDGLLRAMRATLLDFAMQAMPGTSEDGDLLALHCALARQCFLNDYVLSSDAAERQKAVSLRDRLAAAAATGAAMSAWWIAAIGSYMPLHALPAETLDRLLATPWPDPVAPLLALQITEPRHQARIGESIPSLTAVEDRTSRLVQQQYEQSPYPRWRAIRAMTAPVPFGSYLRSRFPLANVDPGDAGSMLDYLIAGCGTGRHVAAVAQTFSGLRLTAIDLSRTSLGYAKTMTDAMGLSGIAYGQADILKIGSIGRSFDVIDSCGVLHHMAEPWAGWCALLSVLRPHGCMRVALYSALGGSPVTAAQRLIGERGYGRDDDDMRRARLDILALPDGHPAKAVAHMVDFYSLSECRDLLFHVQEHKYGLPEIAGFLAEHDLEMIGFEVEATALQRYGQTFPADAGKTDLANWHSLEQQDPDLFKSMYQFWVRRRPTRGQPPG
ncbi:tetratricopeptide repeat protein [Rhodoplanes sp. Z2-YC6860]|uniref:tetratricopeptide repeat protein n=1 Tax=Rhodoplanes sp. Z2-YC6860 TaxID=674703 RepID=UPI00078BC7ED|nr:tetratricopeptide repeat protein [Rhodoplanes sp. Z2-YC6860]AMN44951.1 type 11 methyltransferase [Rhodoplanes sp. Z2-YC6860]